MSSTPLMPTILEVGLQALWLTSKDGVAAKITHIALGEAAYTPHQGLVRLQAERARYPIADGKAVSSTQVHLTALADGNAEFWVREVGFYLADGTCLAIWSDPARPLAYKAAGVDLLLAYDLVLSALPPGSVTVQSTGAGLSLVMAEELAALATAQISEMHRGLKRGDELANHSQRLAAAERRLVAAEEQVAKASGENLRLKAVADERHAVMTELATVQAAGLINLQRIALQPFLIYH